MIKRRDFLKTSAAVMATAAGVRSVSAFAADEAKKKPIGVQLWCVRGEFAKDAPATLAKLKELGYSCIEPFGYGGTDKVMNFTAPELKKMADDAGLTVCGIHMSPAALEGDKFKTAVEVNKTLGNHRLVVSANAAGMKSLDTIKAYAEQLNNASEEAKKLDMRVGYHAHPFDFVVIDGRFAWDHLFSQTVGDVIMQMDVGNCMAGDGDPIAMLEKFPGRCASLHIKENPMGPFGSNGIDWEKIFKLCKTKHKTEVYVVEQGGPDGYELPAQTIAAMQKMGM